MKPTVPQLLRDAAGGRSIGQRPISQRPIRIGFSRSFQDEIRLSSLLKSLNSLYRPALSGIGGAIVAAALPKGLLGRSQAVRQRILIPPFGGSIPPAPASIYPIISGTFCIVGFFILNAVTCRILNVCCQLVRQHMSVALPGSRQHAGLGTLRVTGVALAHNVLRQRCPRDSDLFMQLDMGQLIAHERRYLADVPAPPRELGCPPIRKQGSCDSGYRDVADPRYQLTILPVFLYDFLRSPTAADSARRFMRESLCRQLPVCGAKPT